MNSRLLSDADKIHNRRQRTARRNATKQQTRSTTIRCSVNPVIAALLPTAQLITPEEAWSFRHGSNVKVRRVAKKMTYFSALYCGDWPVLPEIPESDMKDVEPPARRLQVSRRGQPLNAFRGPPVVLPELPASDDRPLVQFLVPAAVELLSKGECRLRIVHAFQQRLRLGLEGSMAILNLVNEFVPRFTTGDLAAVNETLQYLQHFDETRTSYAAMVEAYGIAVARGDWGAYLAEDLEKLRPGIKIPVHLQRKEYLVRFIELCDGEPTEVHFYSRTYLPLFRLPLRVTE